MNGKHYIGKRISSLELYDELGPVTGVALLLDDENEIFSGDETGYVLEMECPYATQDMADNILASVAGSTYKGFRAQDAQLGLDSELGDGVTVGDTYTLLAYQMVSFGAGHVSEIAAPGESVVDHEYPYLSPIQKEIRRNRSEAYSLITKTATEIQMEVATVKQETSVSLGELEEQFKTDLGNLSQDITETLTSYSTITQTASDIASAVETSKEYTDTETGKVLATLDSYSTIEQTAESISSSIRETLYIETETDVLPQQTLTFAVDAGTGTGTATTEDQPIFTIYGPYYVEWDGVEYCVDHIQVDASVTETSDWESVSLTQDGVFSIEKMTDNLTGTVTCTITALDSTAETHTVRIFTCTADEKYSTVEQTSESIRAAVSGLVDGEKCQSMIDVTLEGIQLEISDSQGSSTFVLKSGTTELWTDTFDLHVKAVNVDGTLTADQIDATELKVAAANITGTLALDQMASISFSNLSDYTSVNNRITSASNAASNASAVVTQIANGKYTGGTFIDGKNIYAPSIYGDTISLLDGDSNLVGAMSLVKTSTWAFDITSEMSVRFNAASGYNAALLVDNALGFVARGDVGYCKVIGGPFVVSGHSYGALADRPEDGVAGQVYFAIS